MSKLLISEPPLQVIPSLAVEIGLNEAIALQQVFWMGERSDDGWVRNTVAAWREIFPFWSKRTTERVLAKLRELELIEVSEQGDAWDRGLSYRVLIERVRQLGEVEPANRQSGGVTARQSGGLTRAGETSELPRAKEEEAPPSPPSSDEDQIATVWATYLEVFGSRFVLDARRRKIIRDALKVRTTVECCAAIDGLAVSDYHVQHEYRDISYALKGGGKSPSPDATIDRMGEIARRATNGNVRQTRLAHSQQDLSAYEKPMVTD